MSPTVYITGVGAALPARTLTNEQLVAGMPWLDTSADWIREHTGIRQRHVALPDEHATDLGVRAARQALQRAGTDAAAIDLVLLATNTAQLVYPAGAALILQQLRADAGEGKASVAALDLQQGCASMLAGIILGTAMIQSGSCRRVLVVGADVATRMLDWTNRNSILLGDGASAVVLADQLPAVRTTPALAILGSTMRTVPDRESIYQRGHLDVGNDPFQHMEYAAGLQGGVTASNLYARLAPRGDEPNPHFQMDGRRVYRFVRRAVVATDYLEALRRAGLVAAHEVARFDALTHGEHRDQAAAEQLLTTIASRIDRFVPHGANLALDEELASQMCIPSERMAVTLQDHGNTSTASVGIALERLLRERIRYGTIARRDGDGNVISPSRDVVVEPLRPGHVALMLSFGAGMSWNYVVARAV